MHTAEGKQQSLAYDDNIKYAPNARAEGAGACAHACATDAPCHAAVNHLSRCSCTTAAGNVLGGCTEQCWDHWLCSTAKCSH